MRIRVYTRYWDCVCGLYFIDEQMHENKLHTEQTCSLCGKDMHPVVNLQGRDSFRFRLPASSTFIIEQEI